MMGLASMLMGLLPTYASIGVWAPILLVMLRILQGFALGGESTGAQLMAIEHASPDRRGKYSGLLGLCSPLSQIMANGGAAAAVVDDVGRRRSTRYGWRIPFLLSFVLVVVGVYIRLKVSETPAFVELRKTQVVQVGSPLRDALRLHWRTVLRWMLFFCGPAAIFYLIVVFSLSYITKNARRAEADRLPAADGRECLRDRRRAGGRHAERPDRPQEGARHRLDRDAR